MKVLLDEDVPQPLAKVLTGHEVHTVVGQGWASVGNGRLLLLIEERRFEAFITGDKNMSGQQSLAGRPFAVLVLSATSWPLIKQHLPAIDAALGQAVSGTVVQVDCGVFKPRRSQPLSAP